MLTKQNQRRSVIQKERTKTRLYQQVIAEKDLRPNYRKSCRKLLQLAPNAFDRHFKSDLEFKLYILNRWFMDYYIAHPREPIETYLERVIAHPHLCFLSLLTSAIEQNQVLIVLSEEEIARCYQTYDLEGCMNFLTRCFSRTFLIQLLNRI